MTIQLSFPSILVTDTGHLRGHMRQCHHKACDDYENLNTEDNKQFLASVSQALTYAVMELSTTDQPDIKPNVVEVINNDLGVEKEANKLKSKDDGHVFKNAIEEDHHIQKKTTNGGDSNIIRNLYENVQTQINIENMHFSFSGMPEPKDDLHIYLDPAIKKIKNIVSSFYGDSNNSPMMIKMKNDL